MYFNSTSSLFILLLCFLASAVPPPAPAQEGPQTFRIGVVQDGPATSFDVALARIREETQALTPPDVQVLWTAPDIGNWTREETEASFGRLLANDSLHMVLAIGVLSTRISADNAPFPKPVIAPFGIDPVLFGLPELERGSGLENLNDLVIPDTLERDLEALVDMTGAAEIAVLISPIIAEEASGLAEYTAALSSCASLQFVEFGDDVAISLGTLSPQTDAVYALPMPNLSLEARAQLRSIRLRSKIHRTLVC